jgi:hypothetical protein
MAKGKPTPEKSKIERDRPLAYSRRQKSGGAAGDDPDETKPASDASKAAGNAGATTGSVGSSEPPKAPDQAPETAAPKATADAPAPATAAAEPPAIEPPPPKAEPWPDATPQPMRPVEPARARVGTMEMSPEALSALGLPPEIPAANPGAVEDPTNMPQARDIPHGHPNDPASPPGRVPSGDSRSLRKGTEFVLVYRVQTAVITRFGTVGHRGHWRVVDYPTSSSASNAYAKEVSRFVSEGFSDYRD